MIFTAERRTSLDAYDLRSHRHAEVDVGPVELPARRRRVLGRSLATFQVGESGTGDHLFAAGVDEEYFTALEAFIAEEQEHARLLALVLERIDRPRLERHWTDAVFTLVRRFRSLRTEVLTLLVAEVIAIRYYGALSDGIGDRDLADVFGRIHDDELRHVEFHGDTLPEQLDRFGPLAHNVVRVAWNVLVTGTSVVVALDHGRALGEVGVARRRFVADVWRIRAELDRRLFD